MIDGGGWDQVHASGCRQFAKQCEITRFWEISAYTHPHGMKVHKESPERPIVFIRWYREYLMNVRVHVAVSVGDDTTPTLTLNAICVEPPNSRETTLSTVSLERHSLPHQKISDGERLGQVSLFEVYTCTVSSIGHLLESLCLSIPSNTNHALNHDQ